MMNRKMILSFFFLIFFNNASWSVEANWKEVKGTSSIKVFSGEVKDSPVVAFKGESIIDAPIKKVASVLYDMNRKKEWMHNVEEAKIIRYTTPTERIEYNKTKTPWPLSNRDFVFKAKVELSEDKKVFKIFIDSISDDAEAPKAADTVRGELRDGVYVLESVENDSKTKITVEIIADPKGSVPKWVVNSFQRDWPIKTIEGIRGEVQRPEFVADPKIEQFFSNN